MVPNRAMHHCFYRIEIGGYLPFYFWLQRLLFLPKLIAKSCDLVKKYFQRIFTYLLGRIIPVHSIETIE